jgi:hypothetical protein
LPGPGAEWPVLAMAVAGMASAVTIRPVSAAIRFMMDFLLY